MTGRTDAARGPIRVLYVANRGEIAARIARTAHRMGMEAVAAVVEGPGAVNLLDAASVVAAAKAAGADALHPGYGFLSENAAFAEAVVAAGIRWVGPPAAAIRAMGDKAAARRLAASLDVPVLPGYDDEDQSDEALIAAVGRIGVPVLVKPSGGGGGKGMRVVRSVEEAPDAFAAARREALAAFGNDRLILERFVEGPRHVEIQVLFDEHGAGISLGERDCSLQRRHQKVLEEAPSPAVDAAPREAMGAAAVRLAGAVGYASAGTVEFLLADDGRFSFLEMNTRLQVEHPVTEEVTGRDLVADQLRIAMGETLADVLASGRDASPAHGHAVEVRLYAEDADAGFLPATGRIEALSWPAGAGIRVEAGIAIGDEVGGRFDPMLAKIVAAAESRDAAFDRLAAALDETLVLGLTTNLRFLRWVVRQPAVRAGEVRIDTLERIWPSTDGIPATPDSLWPAAAAILARSAGEGDPWSGGWRLNGPATVRVVSEGEERVVTPSAGPVPRHVVGLDGTLHHDVDGRTVPFRLASPPSVDAHRRSGTTSAAGESDVRAPMPGSVLRVHVEAGQHVESGTPLITLEAMKMEHVVAAPASGVVSDVLVASGEQVAKGQVVAVVR
jgi:acetyl/propionyl-CoA carboxylase alpha subunit